ncbi:dehydrogenase/reductase SDR family member FEY-like [Spinacia oleracea]|uniref:Dehydrogenase/reductase SDR family member FEY-like n=1 Tax=Spinacia oleracea TaxID=3562 RepID=A0ABM3QRD7_SPIOL|nr:dehydrogenase/reductase SDR family member FEY-like [Spinacia oleracea]
MAVRNPKAANELIQKWQTDWSGKGLPLNIEVMELDLLSLDSVAQFAEAWNAGLGPLHVLINNAGIFSIGGSFPYYLYILSPDICYRITLVIVMVFSILCSHHLLFCLLFANATFL